MVLKVLSIYCEEQTMSIKIVSPKNVPMANLRALLHPIQKIFELGWKKYQIDFKGSITPE